MRIDLLALIVVPLVVCVVDASASNQGAELWFREDFTKKLAAGVPKIIQSQDAKTGRFGSGVWICTDQNVLFSLAVAWATKSDDNLCYQDPKVLEAIMAGGDALIDAQDKDGRWRFDKKDGSFWGMTYMPWTYSRWVRAYGLIRDAMPPERRKRWEDALTLGYTGISKTQLGHVHNIPSHHAMGLFIAGKALDKLEWCDQAREFMPKVVAKQDPGGFWSEHHGPVVAYDFVYVDAVGVYHAVSGDESVLPALDRASTFHAAFTYPDGSCVETVDERNPYSPNIRLGNVGFTFTPAGRGYVAQQLELLEKSGRQPAADDMASFIMYGREGSIDPTPSAEPDRRFVLGNGDAIIRRKGPWFSCLSAYHCDIPQNRWQQDRQNLISVFHDKTGLIVGGGNTKMQPLWSTFTVGDTSLLAHTPGDESPDFNPKGPLWHVPSDAVIIQSDPIGVKLKYGDEDCEIWVQPVDDTRLNLRVYSTAESGQPVEAHLTLIPRLSEPLKTESGMEKNLKTDQFTLTAEEAGGCISHAGWRIELPDGSKVIWPVIPHNPYVKDGAPKSADESRIVILVPFSADRREHLVSINVPG